jgi:hypothetical protein
MYVGVSVPAVEMSFRVAILLTFGALLLLLAERVDPSNRQPPWFLLRLSEGDIPEFPRALIILLDPAGDGNDPIHIELETILGNATLMNRIPEHAVFTNSVVFIEVDNEESARWYRNVYRLKNSHWTNTFPEGDWIVCKLGSHEPDHPPHVLTDCQSRGGLDSCIEFWIAHSDPARSRLGRLALETAESIRDSLDSAADLLLSPQVLTNGHGIPKKSRHGEGSSESGRRIEGAEQ